MFQIIVLAASLQLSGLKCRNVSLRPITLIEDPESSCATVTYSVNYPKCAPQTAAVAELNRRMAARARELADYDDARSQVRQADRKPKKSCDETSSEVSGECDVPYAIGSFVSVHCRRFWNSIRSGSSAEPLNFDLVDGTLTEVRLDDVVDEKARARFWEIVRKDLSDQGAVVDDPDANGLTQLHPDFYFTSRALVLDFANRVGSAYTIVELPYSTLQGILKPKYLPPGLGPAAESDRLY